jgi:hypothetical protein
VRIVGEDKKRTPEEILASIRSRDDSYPKKEGGTIVPGRRKEKGGSDKSIWGKLRKAFPFPDSD